MKKLTFLLLCVTLVVAACAPAVNDPGLGAGFRFSTYGVNHNPGPGYWVSVGQRMSTKFAESHPETIWIVGNIYGQGTYLNFPCETSDPYIKCGYVDMNEETFNLFDQNGVRVWLQVEAGNADMDELIRIVMNQYKHHPSIIGFGVDVEWYKSTDGPLGVPITDEEAERWVKAVRAINPEYRLFIKHWELEWMPPNYRDGILFINDHQNFASLDTMLENFNAWGAHFDPAPVGFQYGYMSDRNWWNQLQDPPIDIGKAILENNPNTRGLYWVDFTVFEMFPPE